jgi:hypothetical protein
MWSLAVSARIFSPGIRAMWKSQPTSLTYPYPASSTAWRRFAERPYTSSPATYPNGIKAATARWNMTVARSPFVTTTPVRSGGTPASLQRAASSAKDFGR